MTAAKQPLRTTHREAVGLSAISADPSPGCPGELIPAGNSPEVEVRCPPSHPGAVGHLICWTADGEEFVRPILTFVAARVAVCNGCLARFTLDERGRPHWIERGVRPALLPRRNP